MDGMVYLPGMSSSPFDAVMAEDGEASDSENEKKMEVETSEEKEEKKKDKKKKHKHRHDKESADEGDEEERLRRRLIEKKEKDEGKKKIDFGDEEDELFTIEPGADQKRLKEKERERKEEDRLRNEKERKDFRGDRRDDRKRDERWIGRDRDRWRDDRRGERHGRVENREGKRRRSRSRTVERAKEEKRREGKEREKRRDREEKKDEKGKEEKKEDKRDDKGDIPSVSKETAVEEVKSEVKEEEKMEVDQAHTEEAESATNKDHVKKYSKFESSPESVVSNPSPYIQRLEDEELLDDEEVEETQEEILDLSGIPFEELTAEQRIMLSPDTRRLKESEYQQRLISQLPVYYPGISGCRSVLEFDCLNRIEEGTFGVVYRAKDKRTDEVVALKRLKMEKERDGFPITSLREVNMLLKAGGHENIVNVKEIVVGSNVDKIFLVMEFVEHDMKNLMETMNRQGKKFSMGEVKTLMIQLLRGMEHMHNLWILHRDLKSSNLLLNHKAVLKIGDFGLAREYGDPLKAYTQVVVTLWYRSPELLLGIKKYSTAVDMWSVGCLMAEFLLLKPLFPGKGEVDQVNKIFMELGTPSEKVWKGYDELPGPKQVTFNQHSYNQLHKKFTAAFSAKGLKLLKSLLTYDPELRMSATEALKAEWLSEDPLPTAREMFPTFPAKSELNKKPPEDAIKKEQKAKIEISAAHSKLLNELNVKLDQAAKGFTLKF